MDHSAPVDWLDGRKQRLAQGVTLQLALQEALTGHPELRGSHQGMIALAAAAESAGLRANPDLAIEFEDFGGSGNFSGTGGAQSTLTLSQSMESASKRSARKGLAEAQVAIAQADNALLAQRIAVRVERAFLEALASQEVVARKTLIERELQVFYGTVEGRVQAGKASPLDLQRFDLLLAQARSNRQAAQDRFLSARLALAQCWGGGLEFDEVLGEWPASQAPPELDALLQSWRTSPGGLRLQQELRLGEAVAQVAEQERGRDWTLTAGLRRFEDSDDWAAVVGIELPLRIFNSGSAALEAARARRKQNAFAVQAAERQAQGELIELHGRLTRSFGMISRLEGEALGTAERISSSMAEGYTNGRFDLLQVMDAQRSLFEMRAELGAARLDHHLAWAGLKEWMGETWQ